MQYQRRRDGLCNVCQPLEVELRRALIDAMSVADGDGDGINSGCGSISCHIPDLSMGIFISDRPLSRFLI